MKLNCPNCGEMLSLAALIQQDSAREALRLALEFPAPLSKLFLQYAGLFKPAKRALSMDKFAAILNELLPMIQAAQIERNSRTWPAPQDYWRQAFELMLSGKDKLTLPLKSHGYLLEIIAGFGNKAEAKAEKQHEQGRKYGETQSGNDGVSHMALTRGFNATKEMVQNDKKPRAAMPEDVRKTIKKLTGKASS